MNQINHLKGSLSPYLLQHADNPVHWFAWGEDAFREATERDIPVFLSIGYAACHWCHVMEQESFSDPEIAHLINQNFVPVKVDREERPDIDQLYMTICQVMTGSGGWPMSIFLTPDKHPFYAATYIPKKSRLGMPGLMDLLPYLTEVWKNRRGEIENTGIKLVDVATQISRPAKGQFSDDAPHQAFESLAESYDSIYGGFSEAPKFPSIPQILFLFRYWYRYGSDAAREMAVYTLRQMAGSGIRDHLDGGFHRYATDRAWKIPHFEKMLYDQALLAEAYTDAFRIQPDPFFRSTGEGILDYVCTSLTSPEGGFWSSVDADSPDGEGAYYLWTRSEILDVLGIDDGNRFCSAFGINVAGNSAGHGIPAGMNVLHAGKDPVEILKEDGMVRPEEWLISAKAALLESRKNRTQPAVDDKILTDWNGLMISSLVHGFLTFGHERYYQAAARAGRFFIEQMILPDGRLIHHWHREKRGGTGLSGDYIFMALAFLDLFQADGDSGWMKAAKNLLFHLDFRFLDPRSGGYYQTEMDVTDLPVRMMDLTDHALPSVNGMAALLLERIAKITNEEKYSSRYESIITGTGGISGSGLVSRLSFLSAQMEQDTGYMIVAYMPVHSEEICTILREIRSLYLPGSYIIRIHDQKELFLFIPDSIRRLNSPVIHICGPAQCYPPIRTSEEWRRWKNENIRPDCSDNLS